MSRFWIIIYFISVNFNEKNVFSGRACPTWNGFRSHLKSRNRFNCITQKFSLNINSTKHHASPYIKVELKLLSTTVRLVDKIVDEII